MKVLIVEDNEDSRNLLTKQLSAYGHEVTAAVDGVDALERALKSPPDILVTDILMPRLDGYKLCYEWKRNKRLKNIPFVFYTAIYTSSEDEKFALNLGANLFIRKPVEPEALAKILSQVFEQAKEGLLPAVEAPPKPSLYLSEYNERLVAKLNEKVAELERSEAALGEAEQEKATILNSLSELVILQDLEHRIIWTNKAAGESVGLSPEELVGRHCYEVWGERSETCPGCPLTKVHKTGKPQSGEMTTPDGRVWYVRGYPVRDADGDMTSVVEIVLDITESKRAERALRESEERYRRIFNNSAVALWEMDFSSVREYVEELKKQGMKDLQEHVAANPELIQELQSRIKLLNVNETTLSMFKANTREELYNSFGKLLTDSSARSFARCLQDFDAGKLFYKGEQYQKSIDGEDVVVDLTAVIFPGSEETWDRVLITINDITERKRAEEALRESEAFQSSLLANSPIAVSAINPDTSVRFVNPAMEKLTGFSAKELTGEKAPYSYWAEESTTRTMKGFKKAMRRGGERVVELFKRKNGERFWVEINSVPVKKNGKFQYLLASWVDITERRQAEEALRESEARYRAVIEGAHDMIQSIGLDGSIIFVNKSWLDTLGYTEAELSGLNIFDTIHPDSRAHCRKLMAEVVKGKPVKSIEAAFLTKDGRKILVEGNAAPRYIGDRVVATQGIFRDVTESKQAEEEIARLARFPNENPAPVMRIAQDGTVLYANKAAVPLLKEWECQVGQILPEYWHDFTLDVLRAGSKKDVEVNVGKRKLNLTFAPVAEEGYVNLYGLDITERKRAEEAVRESEEKFKGLAESITDVFFAFDKDLRYTYWNRASEELTGVPAQEALGKHLYDIFPASEATKIAKKMYLKALKTQKAQRFVNDYQLGGKDYFFEISAYPSKDGLSVFVKDITESKKAEEALQQSNKRFTDIAENAREWIWEVDAKGKYTYASPVVEQILGYKPEEVLKKHFYDPFHPDDREKLKKAAFAAFAEKLPFLQFTNRNVHKNGKIVWLSTSGVPIVDEEGELMGYRGADTDITERKKAEEALRESEEKFSKAFHSSPNAMAISTLKEGRFLEVNDGFLRLNGLSREEVIGRTSKELEIWVNPKDRDRILKIMLEKGRVVDEEYKSRTPSGEILTMLFSAEPIDIAGERCIISSASDVTERKLAEEQLRDEATRRRILIDESSDGIVVLDEKGKVYEANRRFAEMLGYTPEEVRKLHVWDWEAEYPREQVAEMIATIGPEGDHFETKHRRKDGTTIDVELSTNGAVFAGRKLIFCVVRDISARKQAEAALKESEEKYKTLVEATSDVIWEVDGEGRFTFVSPRIKDVLGYEVAEVVDKMRTLDLIAKGEKRKWLQRFKELSAQKEPFFGLEITHLHKKGRRVIFETSGIPLFDSEGEFKGFIGINRDITERRNMQEQLVITDRLASVGELAAGIAHELNNPLTGVIGFSQLLMDKEIPKDIKQDVEVVFNEAQRASQVVKNLLTFARKHAAVKEKVNINDVINKVLELRAYEQNLENITVDARLASELPEVMADYFQLQQVFLNIIINAEYFMKEAHRRGKLTITTEIMDGRVRASFADDGPGIAEDDLGHLFDPFFTTKEVGRGTGLGLSICHGIIAEHGGRIYVESELGKGATFIVELPIGAARRKGGAA